MSIIFVLDTNLEVYVVDSVNNQFWLCYSVLRKGRGLNLTDRFEFVFQELLSALDHGKDGHKIDEFYLFVGNRAGFTDTRVIYMWLQTWKQFCWEGNFYIHKIKDSGLKNIEANYQLLITRAKVENNQELIYSGEARVG
jgi:hypothetical protein